MMDYFIMSRNELLAEIEVRLRDIIDIRAKSKQQAERITKLKAALHRMAGLSTMVLSTHSDTDSSHFSVTRDWEGQNIEVANIMKGVDIGIDEHVHAVTDLILAKDHIEELEVAKDSVFDINKKLVTANLCLSARIAELEEENKNLRGHVELCREAAEESELLEAKENPEEARRWVRERLEAFVRLPKLEATLETELRLSATNAEHSKFNVKRIAELEKKLTNAMTRPECTRCSHSMEWYCPACGMEQEGLGSQWQ